VQEAARQTLAQHGKYADTTIDDFPTIVVRREMWCDVNPRGCYRGSRKAVRGCSPIVTRGPRQNTQPA